MSTSDTSPKTPARRMALATLGWLLVVIGPPLGLATPMIPIGFIIFGAGVALVIRNSPKGRSVIRRAMAWFARRYRNLYRRFPRKLRAVLRERDPL